MPRLEQAVFTDGSPASLMFKCPGCGRVHSVYTQHTDPSITGPRWTFNDDMDHPVLHPSLACHYHEEGVSAPGATDKVCHSYVGCNGAQPGQIIFLGDCTHQHAGKIMDLPDLGPEGIEL